MEYYKKGFLFTDNMKLDERNKSLKRTESKSKEVIYNKK